MLKLKNIFTLLILKDISTSEKKTFRNKEPFRSTVKLLKLLEISKVHAHVE